MNSYQIFESVQIAVGGDEEFVKQFETVCGQPARPTNTGFREVFLTPRAMRERKVRQWLKKNAKAYRRR